MATKLGEALAGAIKTQLGKTRPDQPGKAPPPPQAPPPPADPGAPGCGSCPIGGP